MAGSGFGDAFAPLAQWLGQAFNSANSGAQGIQGSQPQPGASPTLLPQTNGFGQPVHSQQPASSLPSDSLNPGMATPIASASPPVSNAQAQTPSISSASQPSPSTVQNGGFMGGSFGSGGITPWAVAASLPALFQTGLFK